MAGVDHLLIMARMLGFSKTGEVFSTDLSQVHPAVREELPWSIQHALKAGATPPLRYLGAGAYGIVFCDAKDDAYKVYRAFSLYLNQAAKDEGEWLAAANDSPTLRPHVPRFIRFDDRNKVLVRECLRGSPGGWSDETMLSTLHNKLEKAAVSEMGWTMPEFKADSWVLDEKSGVWKIVDASLVQRLGMTLAKHVEDVLEGRVAPYTTPEDLAFFVRREAEPPNRTIPPEVAEKLLERLKTGPRPPSVTNGHAIDWHPDSDAVSEIASWYRRQHWFSPGDRLMKMQFIPVEKIEPTESFDDEKVQALVSALSTDPGSIPPIVVNYSGDEYDIADGHHRFAAAQRLGIKKIPALLHLFEDETFVREEAPANGNGHETALPYDVSYFVHEHLNPGDREKLIASGWIESSARESSRAGLEAAARRFAGGGFLVTRRWDPETSKWSLFSKPADGLKDIIKAAVLIPGVPPLDGKLKFVIGAPHAYCTRKLMQDIRDDSGHLCDFITGPIAQRVGAILGAEVMLAPREREKGDLNRDATIGDAWRTQLESKLDANVVYVDIHSFPRSDRDFGSYDFVLLTEGSCAMWLYNGVKNGLQKRGFGVGVYAGRYNSLIRRACEGRAKAAILIEVNESFAGREIAVANAIAGALMETAET